MQLSGEGGMQAEQVLTAVSEAVAQVENEPGAAEGAMRLTGQRVMFHSVLIAPGFRWRMSDGSALLDVALRVARGEILAPVTVDTPEGPYLVALSCWEVLDGVETLRVVFRSPPSVDQVLCTFSIAPSP